MNNGIQGLLFPTADMTPRVSSEQSSTFTNNMKLPVHRWIRYSAGFSAVWAEGVIREHAERGPCRVLDPFAGSGTTLIAAENVGVESFGLDAHPFVHRFARAKLARRSDPGLYSDLVRRVVRFAKDSTPDASAYATLIRECYTEPTLLELDALRQAVEHFADGSPSAQLVWLTLVGILRKVSHVGTAQWQYVLPRKSKKSPRQPFPAFEEMAKTVYDDMVLSQEVRGPAATLLEADARTCAGVPDGFANLVVTSPPYPNNYDYADATRLEMSFFGEVRRWADLQCAVRKYLLRSCSQHVPEKTVDLDAVLSREELEPIRADITKVCRQLSDVRLSKGGKKTYHLMVACYFLDLAKTWRALRRACASPCRVCFVIGDSAPYGVYVPVMEWLGALALAAGFSDFAFTRTRDRNVKWKNRKHRVPLCEGHLWVNG